MKYVLVTVRSGIASDAEFFDDVTEAIRELAALAKGINLEKEDAAVFSENGLVANARGLFDWYGRISSERLESMDQAA